MSYLVLARKYRPRTFDEVVGQQTVTRTLRNAIESGRVGHAFLLSGARGVGKTSTARLLAKALNCGASERPTADPCGSCSSCVEIAEGKSLDVQEIDGASNNSVDNVRELRESARYNPARDRYKIWIIDEVHQLSGPAFNALLKTLEEPPPRVKFIFATTEYHKLPDTILSRCQQYDFRLVPAGELLAHLKEVAKKEEIEVSEQALERIARAAEGSVRDALSLFDQVLAFSGQQVKDEDLQALLGLIDRELLLQASGAVAAGDSRAIFELVERLADYGADYRNFSRELLLHFRELLLAKLVPEGGALLGSLRPEERARLSAAAAAFSEEDLLRAFEVLQKAELDLRQTPDDPRVTLEFALLKLAQMRKLVPFTELVERVERLASGAAPAAPRAEPPARRAAPTPEPPARGVPELPLSAPETDTPRKRPLEAVPAPAAAESGARIAVVAATVEMPAAPAAEDALLTSMLALIEKRPSLREPLRGARTRLDGEVLSIEVVADYAVLAAAHADEYRELALQAAGRRLDVRIEAQGSASAEPAPPNPAVLKKQRLMQEAAGEKAVQEVLELFGGKVVDVREA